MATNALVTGPPRSGKTTALERTVSRLREDGYAVGGLSSPERREDGERVGFEIVDIASGERAVMAHVEYDGPSVGKYGVDVAAVDRLAGTALPTAIESADCIVVDEIAPMQLESERFREETRRALESPTPVLSAIKSDGSDEFIGAVKERTDTERFVVEPETRDALPETLDAWLRSTLQPR
ncbi:nucleoside-triphosphatase [Natronolimnohabitans sp. A-GB9]|uniref:nucleoside-triphosphatase n=1 Tax=Natronolimnohabitans sp. A-GB9 TaxID=3069757 RepID=UPI0027B784DB|nr:nucleoside-triphosphatase [Natronolimnohabitans sp. A-GB9]MDQ2051208.1 nucleoside-triphosphatase [Natronolimnohabitans sp. A-GB9]